MNRDDYTYICRQTDPRIVRKMDPRQLMRRLSEIREYVVDSMLCGCEDCVDFNTQSKDRHCDHCSRNMGDFFRKRKE